MRSPRSAHSVSAVQAALAICLFYVMLRAPAGALVGDAAFAEWTMARPTVMVYVPERRGACSGVVLAQDLVLTAAHCVGSADFKAGGFIAGYIAGGLFRLANIAEVVSHPKYSEAARETDLALLKLSAPLTTTFAPAIYA